ncbi:MAG: V-type ATPase subunit [Spirochaetales bacterium]|nr:V-type ATPase subunit [Spirochaetales bacterium]
MTRVATYGFVNAKLRARISMMLPRDWMLQMADAHSLTEAVAKLNGTPYESASVTYQKTGDLKLVEAELLRLERDDVLGVQRFLAGAPAALAEALFRRYEIETLKNALRVWFARTVAGRPSDDVVAYLDHDTTRSGFSVDAIVNAPDMDSLLLALSGTPYGAIAAAELPEVAQRESLFRLELALDRRHYAELRVAIEALDAQDSAVAKRLLGIHIDLLNLLWVVRVKEFYQLPEQEVLGSLLSGGAAFNERVIESIYRSDAPLESIVGVLSDRYTGAETLAGESDDIRRLALLAAMLQEVLMHEIHRVMGGYPFNVGIVVAYVLLRQNEVRMITTVLNARHYGIAPDAVGSML